MPLTARHGISEGFYYLFFLLLVINSKTSKCNIQTCVNGPQHSIYFYNKSTPLYSERGFGESGSGAAGGQLNN